MSDDIEAAARRAERRIKAVSLQHHAHEDSAVLLHALLVDVPAAIEEEFMALRSALLARLARVEEALRFYADEGTYCLSHPAHGGYECCGGGDEGPIIEDRGSKARAALAKNAGNTTPTATGEAPPCGCDIDATRHDRSCPAYTGNAAPTPPPATGEAGTREAEIRADERKRCVKAARQAALVDYGTANQFDALCQQRDKCADAIEARALPEARDGKGEADPRGEDGAAIDEQDPMAEYVAASLKWWLDESPEAERMEGETWKRFHRAYYRLPVSVRMGAR